MNKKIICPDCSQEIKVKKMLVGDIVECQNCGSEVEILSLKPLKYSLLLEEK